MKKFKRLGTLFLCATLILSLAACGKSGSETPSCSETPNALLHPHRMTPMTNILL